MEHKDNPEDRQAPPQYDFTARGGSIPDLMTEKELVEYLRIPEISCSKNSHNVVENLKRMHNLPRMPICGKVLYPLKAVQEWIERKTEARDG